MHRPAFAVVVGALALLSATPASARVIIREPDPPRYHVEVEPHIDIEGLGADGTLFGFGAGARVSIPLMSPGFVPSINDSIAISFGGDLVDFPSGRTVCNANQCASADGFTVLYAPIAMQWNFFITDKWSVFGEPGIALRHSFASSCAIDPVICDGTDRARVVIAVGGRYHFSNSMALTMRLGVPVLASVGLSFF
jgi:hypothetical protein